MKNNDPRRAAELARIHIAKKELGLDDATYRAMLFSVAGVESAAKLSAHGRQKVLEHMRRCGWQGKAGPKTATYPGRPHNMDQRDRGRLLHKIEALLAEAKRPWSYADSMARKMFGIERIAWCLPEQLHSIVAALVYDAKRHGRYTGPTRRKKT